MMIGLFLVLALAPSQIGRGGDDGKAVDRVVEISRGRDLPNDILRRIVGEDLDILRGRHADDTYDFASYERLEASRISSSSSGQPRRRGRPARDTYDFASYERLEASRISSSSSVEPTGEDKLTRIETKGDFVYRVVLEMPNRRMIVTRNRPVFVDRLEVESIPMASSVKRSEER